ncbi:ABC transporter permease, partial [candidate division KSB1 bacterium]|nr:ABC transporter permease [candidate division KSB1 bacterium]
NMICSHENKRFVEDRILAVDPEFFKIFDFTVLSGDPGQALRDPNSIVITRKIAEKYFGRTDVQGEQLKLENRHFVNINAVIENLPANTHLDFDMLIPLTLARQKGREIFPDVWHRFDEICTYVLLQKKYPHEILNPKIAALKQSFSPEWDDELYLQPITKIHTSPEIEYNMAPSMDIKLVYIFSAIAAFILLIACINFINLSTARAAHRSKEIGLRKVIGASRGGLIKQLLGESVAFSLLAFLIAALLVKVFMPVLRNLTGHNMTFHLWQHWTAILIFILFALLIGIVAGIYPAFYLSGYQPLQNIKRQNYARGQGGNLRRALVVFQFSISILLIIGTIIVYSQLSYMKNKQPGYNKENLLSIPLNMPPGEGIFSPKFENFRAELLAYPGVLGVTMACCSPEDVGTSAGEASWDGKPDDYKLLVRWNVVFFDYFETLDVPVVAGRSFSRDYPGDINEGDNRNGFILNEAAVKAMGVKDPLNINFELYNNRGPVVGVVKDFHYRSFRSNIEPMAFFINPFFNRVVLVRVEPANVQQSIRHIRETWEKFAAAYPFEYSFVSEEYEKNYAGEERILTFIQYFSALAILIACMGLFGLSAYDTEQRSREIGVRKVTGASIRSIVILLSREFSKWVLAANLIAWPVAWFVCNNWLQNFAYRINIELWVFIVAGFLAFVIAFITVAFQTVKAAMANPVEVLRYE